MRAARARRRPAAGAGLLAALALAAGLASGADAEEADPCAEGPCVEWSHSPNGVVLEARNPLPIPAFLGLELYELENMRVAAGGGDTVDALLAPGSRRELAILEPIEPRKKPEFRFRWTHVLGTPGAVHDEAARYVMPFGGEAPRKLSQGPQGGFSHRGEVAYDFLLPEGTPVVAARAGVVAQVVDRFAKGGRRKTLSGKANRVLVVHEDGTLARYLHLRRDAAAEVGDAVGAGQLLGWSGNTGFTTAPHLHFDVIRVTEAHEQESLEIRFAAEAPQGFRPVAGQYYPPTAPEEDGAEAGG